MVFKIAKNKTSSIISWMMGKDIITMTLSCSHHIIIRINLSLQIKVQAEELFYIQFLWSIIARLQFLIQIKTYKKS
jgi:hypothetical protein